MDFKEYVETKYPYFFDHEGSLLIPDDNSYEKPFALSDLIDCWNASAEVHKPRWIPIEEYNKMEIKPKNCIFYFKDLCGVFSTSRNYDFRTCTHWLELPELPEEK